MSIQPVQNPHFFIYHSSDNERVRVEKMDYGSIITVNKQQLSTMNKQHMLIERQLMYISMMNIVPSLQRDWRKSDVTDVYGFVYKANDKFLLNIAPNWKVDNIMLAASLNVVSTESSASYSLIEHVLNANVGRVDESGLREFVGLLADWHIIDHTTRAFVVNSSKRAAERAQRFAYDILSKLNDSAVDADVDHVKAESDDDDDHESDKKVIDEGESNGKVIDAAEPNNIETTGLKK